MTSVTKLLVKRCLTIAFLIHRRYPILYILISSISSLPLSKLRVQHNSIPLSFRRHMTSLLSIYSYLLLRSLLTLYIESICDFRILDATLKHRQLLSYVRPLYILLHKWSVLFLDIDLLTAICILDYLLKQSFQALFLNKKARFLFIISL